MNQLFSDHSALPVLTQVAQENQFRPLQSKLGLSQQFWATPDRPAVSGAIEALEVSLVSQQLVNWLQLDLAKYPHEVSVEYFDDPSDSWLPLLDSTGTPVSSFVHESVPQIIPPPSSVTGARHPQHSFDRHWLTINFELTPVELQRLRIKLVRVNTAACPVDVYGNRVDYSLAVRNLSFGYQVTSLDDVPRNLPQSEHTYYDPFAQSQDVVSSTVNFALRQHDASYIIGEGESDLIWRCEPQPDANTVVSMHADLRDSHGNPQVVDRIFIDPVVNGPHITLYFSNDEPTDDFESPSDPLSASYVDATPGITLDDYGLHMPGSSTPVQEIYDFVASDTYTLGSTSTIPNLPDSIEASTVIVTGRDTDGNPITYVLGTDYTYAAGVVTRLGTGAIPNDGSQQATISYEWFGGDSMLIPNRSIGWNIDTPWMVGLTVTPRFNVADLDVPKILLGTEIFTLGWLTSAIAGSATEAIDLSSGSYALNYADATSIVVTGNQGTTTYSLGTDYTVSAGVITRVSGGSIPADGSGDIEASYSYVVNLPSLVFNTVGGESITAPLDYQQNQQISLVLGYDGNQYYLTVGNSQWVQTFATPSVIVYAPSSIQTIALGSDLARIDFGLTDFQHLVIRSESPADMGQDYIENPTAYCSVLPFARDEDDRSRMNNLLRFDPTSHLTSPVYPWCLFAGIPSKYASMVWTPITRDYTCQRGWIELPPTQAKYWKLEFTHLQPQYSDVYQPTTMTVKRFPPSVVAEYGQRLAVQSALANDPGLEQQQQLAGFSAYDDVPTAVSTGGTGLGYTNTEVLVAADHGTAERLTNLGEQWSFVENQPSQSAPRFTVSQRHIYREEIVTRKAKIGYIVGLRRLNFARTSYSSSYDTPQYEDMFYDQMHIASSTWTYDERLQALTSGGSKSASAVSTTFASNRDVRGLQFAAQQSPARSMLDDPDFDDPDHVQWLPSGDVLIGDVIDSPAFGQLLPVSRQRRSGTWGDAEGLYPTWGSFVAASATYGSLSEKIGTTPSGSDGLKSVTIPQPKGGYLYGVARVISDNDLSAPLWLQIYDSISGVVLAEEPRTIYKGQIAEWYCTYRIGTGKVHLGDVTWGDLAGITTHTQGFADSFHRADASELGWMTSGQQWQVDPTVNCDGLSIVSNEAAVTAAYPAQCSAIDLQTPWGDLTIQLGNLVSAPYHDAGILPLIKLGGFWLMNDGEIIDANTGRELMHLTLASDDTLRFSFMPTNLLPSGQNPAGVDSSLQSWAFTVTQNGTYEGTVAGSQAFQTTRAITGDVGQTFKSMLWEPRADLDIPTAPKIVNYPSAYEIASTDTDPATGDVEIVDRWDNHFLVTPTGTYTDATPPYAALDLANGIVAAAATDAFVKITASTVDGTLVGYYDCSGTSSDRSTWNMLLLDDTGTRQLFVRANGDLVVTTPSTGDTVLAANRFGLTTPANGVVDDFEVIMITTSKLSAAFKTANSITDGSGKQTLIFTRAGVVESTYTDVGLWTGSTRAVMTYDGAKSIGVSWSPIPGVVTATVGSSRTWGDVDANNTRTWGDVLASDDAVIRNPVSVRVVQKTTTLDQWSFNSVDMYYQPIVWEFSNNNGAIWVPASEVRNNPNAAVLFDPKDDTVTANQLVYRVSSFDSDAWVSHLVIRPWYRGFMRDMPVKPAQPHGPNLNPQDHYTTVDQDPNWQVWHEPIPREWWYVFRQLLPNIVPKRSKLPMVTERISINV